MKPVIAILFFLLLFNTIKAQTKIMDAKLSGSGLSVWLTETDNITSITIAVGTAPDSTDIYSAQYSSLTDFGNHGTVEDNMLNENVGSVPSGAYAKVTIISNGVTEEIAVRKSDW